MQKISFLPDNVFFIWITGSLDSCSLTSFTLSFRIQIRENQPSILYYCATFDEVEEVLLSRGAIETKFWQAWNSDSECVFKAWHRCSSSEERVKLKGNSFTVATGYLLSLSLKIIWWDIAASHGHQKNSPLSRAHYVHSSGLINIDSNFGPTLVQMFKCLALNWVWNPGSRFSTGKWH